jgi:hypothetical protein
MIWAVVQLAAPLATTAGLVSLAAVVALLGYAALAGRWLDEAPAQAFVLLLVIPLLFAAMRPVALPDQGEQLARRLEGLGLADGSRVLFVGELGTAGKLRVALGGRVRVARVDRLPDASRNGYQAVVLPPADAAALAASGDRVLPGSRGYASLDVARLLAAAFKGELKDFLARHRSELAILIPAAHAEA